MVWIGYNLLLALVFPCLLPRYLARMLRRGGYRRRFLERLGWYTPEVRRRLSERPRIWVHGVSVGEVGVALRLTQEMRARNGNLAFVISTTTPTGRAVAEAQRHPEDWVVYAPMDFPSPVRRALAAIRPEALVLIEGELWPNLWRRTNRQGIPIFVVNARLSPRSYRGYRRAKCLMRRVLQCAQRIFAQTEADRQRFIDLGASPGQVTVSGNVKFDVAVRAPTDPQIAADLLRRSGLGVASFRWVGGSTWPGEEDILLAVYRRLRPEFPELRLILVPRHAERRHEVEEAIRRAGLRGVLRSALDTAPPSSLPPDPDVLLVDSTGELRSFYANAELVFVGKSLTAHGGQNPIEPAVEGKPILFGPFMENFAEVAEILTAEGAALCVRNERELEQAVRHLLRSKERRGEMGQRAAALCARQTGALARTAEALLAVLDSSSPARKEPRR